MSDIDVVREIDAATAAGDGEPAGEVSVVATTEAMSTARSAR